MASRGAQHRTEQLRVMSEVSRQITSVLDAEVVIHTVVRLIHEAFDYYHVAIATIEGDEAVYRVGAGKLWDDPGFRFRPSRLKVGKEGLTGWVAANGKPLLVSDVSKDSRYIRMSDSKTRSELVVPIMSKGIVMGVMDIQSTQLDAFDENDLLMVQSLADQTAVAIENARLYKQAQHAAVLEERQRLARDLHDSVTQSMYGVTLYAEAASRHLAEGDNIKTAEYLAQLQETAREALSEMRMLIYELLPSVLQEQGLVGALEMRLEAVEARAGLAVSFVDNVYGRVPPALEGMVYRIAQEALNNVLKHAHATKLNVLLEYDNNRFVLEVVDNGNGFDVDAVERSGGLGLKGMRERAAQINASLKLTSVVGSGTTIRLESANEDQL